jgi:DNA primase
MPELDPERLHTILAARGAAALVEKLGLKQGLGFSFTRRDAEPERACRELVLAIDTLAARPGLYAELEAATSRLKETLRGEVDEGLRLAAEAEQNRLSAAAREADETLIRLNRGDDLA